ncbi:MAG: hypothetical protein GX638_18285 [Crenarchaeota archaeon]|nr:hypothetical protein [Thermoproteota archaeon]
MIKQTNTTNAKGKISGLSLHTLWHNFLQTTIQCDIPTCNERYGEIKE